ncbi:6747_t:CDS:2 [Rhizophagus irregularis]|nr:6747_t:CDS:2 [Rhizophagus irregularis]
MDDNELNYDFSGYIDYMNVESIEESLSESSKLTFSQFSESISKPNLIISKQRMDKDTNITTMSIFLCGSTLNCNYKEINDEKKCDHEFSLKDDDNTTCSSYSLDFQNEIIIEQITNNKYVYGLAGGEKDEYVDFNAHMDHATTSTTPDKTTLILRPTSKSIYYQEESYYDFNSITSNIGGFFGFLSGIFVFLFGASKLAPWGFLQTHVFNCLCTRYRRRLIRKLKSKYEPIPFVSGRTKNFTLEERVQSIENLLEEYYLNTDFLNLLLEDNKDNKVDDKV